MQKLEFNADKDAYALVQTTRSGEFGHIYVHFNNLIPRVFGSEEFRLRISSQFSDSRDFGTGRATGYAYRFGLCGEDVSLAQAEKGLAMMRKVQRKLNTLTEQLGEMPYDPSFTQYALRHIMAAGVKWVLFKNDPDGRSWRFNLEDLKRVKGWDQPSIQAGLAELEASMIALMSRHSHTA